MKRMIRYYEYRPVAQLYVNYVEAGELIAQPNIHPVTLPAKLIRFFYDDPQYKYLVENLEDEVGIEGVFDAVAVRLHSLLVEFTNDYFVKGELCFFNFNTEVLSPGRRQVTSSVPGLSTGWSIRTRKEDAYVELATTFSGATRPVPLATRLINKIRRKGPTTKDIPVLKNNLTVKVFSSPASCYALDLVQLDTTAQFSPSAIEQSRLDFYEGTITQEAKNRYERRKPYFRQQIGH